MSPMTSLAHQGVTWSFERRATTDGCAGGRRSAHCLVRQFAQRSLAQEVDLDTLRIDTGGIVTQHFECLPRSMVALAEQADGRRKCADLSEDYLDGRGGHRPGRAATDLSACSQCGYSYGFFVQQPNGGKSWSASRSR